MTQTRMPTLGWAYQRGNAWWLPLFYLREDGQVLVISLSVDAAFKQWLAPALPGEDPVGLRAADDRVLLRLPFTPAMLGADARGAASSRLMNEARSVGSTAGSVRAVATETDSVERLIGWFTVPGTDLRILVAASVGNDFIQWRAREAPKFLAMATFIMLAMGGAAMSLRQQYRLGARDRQALDKTEVAQALTKAALLGSRDITGYPGRKPMLDFERQAECERWMALSWLPDRPWVALDDVAGALRARLRQHGCRRGG